MQARAVRRAGAPARSRAPARERLIPDTPFQLPPPCFGSDGVCPFPDEEWPISSAKPNRSARLRRGPVRIRGPLSEQRGPSPDHHLRERPQHAQYSPTSAPTAVAARPTQCQPWIREFPEPARTASARRAHPHWRAAWSPASQNPWPATAAIERLGRAVATSCVRLLAFLAFA